MFVVCTNVVWRDHPPNGLLTHPHTKKSKKTTTKVKVFFKLTQVGVPRRGGQGPKQHSSTQTVGIVANGRLQSDPIERRKR